MSAKHLPTGGCGRPGHVTSQPDPSEGDAATLYCVTCEEQARETERRGGIKIVVRLTRSQQMALADILVHYALLNDQPQNFIDLAENVTTTTGELLTLFTDMREVELT